MRILARHLHTFVSYAQLRGISEAEIMRLLENPSVNLQADTATISVDDFYTALAYIEERLADALLGLRIGEYLNLNALGLVYQISLQATTVEEGLLYLKSFLNATLPIIRMETIMQEDTVMICLNVDEGEEILNRILLESTLTVISRELGKMAGEELSARLSSPFHTAGYPAQWSKGEEFAITFVPGILRASIMDKSRLHLDVLIPQFLKLIESVQCEETFTSRVKIAALHMAKPELPSLEQIADIFNLTPRTFQRRLSTENYTFRQLIDELKKQLSYLLLHHIRFSIADVAYVLGYAEPAAFIHAFKKWFGHPPQKYRQQLTL